MFATTNLHKELEHQSNKVRTYLRYNEPKPIAETEYERHIHLGDKTQNKEIDQVGTVATLRITTESSITQILEQKFFGALQKNVKLKRIKIFSDNSTMSTPSEKFMHRFLEIIQNKPHLEAIAINGYNLSILDTYLITELLENANQLLCLDLSKNLWSCSKISDLEYLSNQALKMLLKAVHKNKLALQELYLQPHADCSSTVSREVMDYAYQVLLDKPSIIQFSLQAELICNMFTFREDLQNRVIYNTWMHDCFNLVKQRLAVKLLDHYLNAIILSIDHNNDESCEVLFPLAIVSLRRFNKETITLHELHKQKAKDDNNGTYLSSFTRIIMDKYKIQNEDHDVIAAKIIGNDNFATIIAEFQNTFANKRSLTIS
jgi:hypothetical protein